MMFFAVADENTLSSVGESLHYIMDYLEQTFDISTKWYQENYLKVTPDK